MDLLRQNPAWGRLLTSAAPFLLLTAQSLDAWPMPRIPREQIPDDMPPEIRKHVEGLYDIRDDNVCLASVKALGEMGPAAAPAAPFLASILDRHKTCQTPNAAIDALVRIGQASVEPTILALKVGDAYGRSRAVSILRQLKDPRAIAPLVNAIADGLGGRDDIAALVELGGTEYLLNIARDPSPELRQVAMRVLPRVSNPKAAEALVKGLDDPHEKVRQLAVHGLNDLLSRDPSTSIPATNSILAALKAPDSETRRHTLRLVMRLNFAPGDKGRSVAPMLSDPDASVLSEVVRALGSLRTDESVDLLRTVEKHPDPLVRAALASALGETGKASAVQTVESLLGDPAGIVREHAAGALAALKGRDEAPRLVALMKADRDALVRRRILQILGDWKYAAIVSDLDTYLGDDDESVRTAALDLAGAAGTNGIAVLVHGLRNPSEKVREHAAGVLERSTRPSPEGTSLLLELMASPDEDVRSRAIHLLKRDPSLIGDLDPIARAADDASVRIQSSAIQILGARKDRHRIDSIRAAARKYDEGLALSAVGALGQLGDVPALAEAGAHPMRSVSHAAIEALSRQGTPEAQKAIAEIQKRSSRTDIQPLIASAVSERSGKTATPEMVISSLVTSRGQPSPSLRTRLIAMGTNVTDLLAGLLTNDPPSLRSAVVDMLGEIKATSSVPHIISAVDDPASDVRDRAIFVLGTMRATGAVEVISTALADESSSVREQAVLALGAIADPACLPGLVALTNATDWRMRALVMQSIGRIGDARSTPAVRDALTDTHWHVRRMAAEALGSIGDRKVVPDLIARLEDPHWSVRRSAGASLRALTGESLGQELSAWQRWWQEGQGRTAATNSAGRTK